MPLVSVSLVKNVNLLPHQSVVAQVQCNQKAVTCFIEEAQGLQQETGVLCEATLTQSDDNGLAKLILSNTNGYSCCVRAGEMVGVSQVVSLVESEPPETESSRLPPEPASVYTLLSQSVRGQLLRELVGKGTG